MRVSLRSYLRSRICDRQAKIMALGMVDRSPELQFLVELQNRFTFFLKLGYEEAMRTVSGVVEDEVSRDWYTCDAEYAAAKQKYHQQLGRMVEYFFDNDYIIEDSSNQPRYETWLGDYTVFGKVGVVAIDEDGDDVNIFFDFIGVNQSSPKARKEENLPEHSLELLIPAAGLVNNPGVVSLKVAVWHLRGKDDHGGNYPPFELKAGGNINSYDFSGRDLNALLAKAVVVPPAEKDCGKCRCRGVCKGYKPCIAVQSTDGAQQPAKVYELTPAQEEVVSHRDGPLCVVAGPGSGKTHVIVERMRRLVESGVKPSNIVLITFTNKARDEILERVSRILGVSSDDADRLPVISTIHGFAYKLLRQNERLLKKHVRLAVESVKKELVEKALNEEQPIGGVSYVGMLFEHGLVDRVVQWFDLIESKGEAFFIQRYPNLDHAGIFRVYAAFEKLYGQAGYIGYEDQINLINEIFDEHPRLLEKYSLIYRYIMVDEYQDIAKNQHRFITRLAQHGNLVIVGDDDQAIYAFRGGSNAHMIGFAHDFKKVILQDNFRSSNAVACVANAVISHNDERIVKETVAHQTGDVPLLMLEPTDDKVVATVEALSRKYGAGNVAVLARTNSELERLANLFAKDGQSCTGFKDYLIEDRIFCVIRDVLAVHEIGPVRAAESFSRLFLTYVSDIDAQAVIEQTEQTNEYGHSFYEDLVNRGKLLPLENTRENMLAYRRAASSLPYREFGLMLFKSYKIISQTRDVQDCLDALFEVWFPNEADNVNAQNVLKCLEEMLHNDRTETAAGLREFVERLVKYHDTSRVTYSYEKDALNLMTAHDSKGREFDAVVVVGADSFFKDLLEEDRRLLYVAITRARHSLVITTYGLEMQQEVIKEVQQTVNII